jgi:aryl-alcohol dehydrogenase-like predicted oxidoreductase
VIPRFTLSRDYSISRVIKGGWHLAVDRGYVEAIIDRSLTRLGMERLDLVQFHWWDFAIPRPVSPGVATPDG